MMYRAMLMILFGSVALAAPVPAHLMKDGPASYYPAIAGTKLVYDRGGEEETRIIAKVETAADGSRTVITDQVLEGGGLQPFHRVLLNSKGVFITERAGTKYPAPFELIRLPFKAGDKWEEVPGSKAHGMREAVREEKIKVPAGEFNCLRIETRSSTAPTIHWYAAGIGVVKVDYGDHKMELKSITHPKR